MARITGLTFVFLLLLQTIKASDTLTVASVDILTYDYYTTGKWKPLVVLGKEANKQGIDFYYLQLRMATAYFYLQQYRDAAKYFEKSLQTEPDYEYTLEYLFYSYLYAGQKFKAQLLAQKFSAELKEKTGAEYGLIDYFYLEGGMKFTADKNNHQAFSSGASLSLNPEKTVPKQYRYAQFASGFNVSRRVALTGAVSKLNLDRNTYFMDQTESLQEETGSIEQTQQYLASSFYLGKGFILNAAWHRVAGEIDLYDLYFYTTYHDEREVSSRIVSTRPRVEEMTIDSVFQLPDVEQGQGYYSTSFSDNVGYISLFKDFTKFTLEAEVSYGDLNNSKQLQAGFHLYEYPFGNLNVYGQTSLILKRNEPLAAKREYLLKQCIGKKIHEHLWIEGSFEYGYINNYVANNALVLYNTLDYSLSKFGFNLLVPFHKVSLFLMYQYSLAQTQEYNNSITETEMQFNASQTVVRTQSGIGGQVNKTTSNTQYIQNRAAPTYIQTQKNSNYNTHSIIGGIKWEL